MIDILVSIGMITSRSSNFYIPVECHRKSSKLLIGNYLRITKGHLYEGKICRVIGCCSPSKYTVMILNLFREKIVQFVELSALFVSTLSFPTDCSEAELMAMNSDKLIPSILGSFDAKSIINEEGPNIVHTSNSSDTDESSILLSSPITEVDSPLPSWLPNSPIDDILSIEDNLNQVVYNKILRPRKGKISFKCDKIAQSTAYPHGNDTIAERTTHKFKRKLNKHAQLKRYTFKQKDVSIFA